MISPAPVIYLICLRWTSFFFFFKKLYINPYNVFSLLHQLMTLKLHFCVQPPPPVNDTNPYNVFRPREKAHRLHTRRVSAVAPLNYFAEKFSLMLVKWLLFHLLEWPVSFCVACFSLFLSHLLDAAEGKQCAVFWKASPGNHPPLVVCHLIFPSSDLMLVWFSYCCTGFGIWSLLPWILLKKDFKSVLDIYLLFFKAFNKLLR